MNERGQRTRWELDHVFVATPNPGQEAVAAAFGLTFTDHRRHPGQGTANACAPFENAYCELLFPTLPAELDAEVVRPLGLKERIDCERTGACPFGICYRPLDALAADTSLPFETWPYRPEYVPAGASIPIVTPPLSLFEPLLFAMTRPRAPHPGSSVLHRGAKRTLTSVIVHTPHPSVSTPVAWFTDSGLLTLVQAPNYLLELVLDHGSSGNAERMAPDLPLAVRW